MIPVRITNHRTLLGGAGVVSVHVDLWLTYNPAWGLWGVDLGSASGLTTRFTDLERLSQLHDCMAGKFPRNVAATM